LNTKPKYSTKVRALGYAVILLEISTVILWAIAWYGNGMAMASVVESAAGIAGGQRAVLQNTTSGVSLTIPVKGGGFFPVTVNVVITFINGQNQTVAQSRGGVTVSPGQSQSLTLNFPISPSNATLSSYRIRGSFQISSLGNLVGFKVGTTISAENVTGGASP
jgi:hypothetical protein